jgi:hypothetical protein
MFGSFLPSRLLVGLVATKVYSATGADIVMESITLIIPVNERYRLWVLKKSVNRTPFHLRACRRRFSCLRSTKWWPAQPVLSAD